jgi:hypothetical protein
MATAPKFAVDTTGQISNGTYKYYLPASAGTLALTSQIPTNSSFTLAGLSEKSYNSLTDKPTIPANSSFTLAGLSEKNFSSLANKPTTISGYGITDGAKIDASNLSAGNISSWLSKLALNNVQNYKIVNGLQAKSSSNPYSISTGLTTIYGFYTQIVNNTTNSFGEIILLHSISGGTVYCSQRNSGSGNVQQCTHYWTAIGI